MSRSTQTKTADPGSKGRPSDQPRRRGSLPRRTSVGSVYARSVSARIGSRDTKSSGTAGPHVVRVRVPRERDARRDTPRRTGVPHVITDRKAHCRLPARPGCPRSAMTKPRVFESQEGTAPPNDRRAWCERASEAQIALRLGAHTRPDADCPPRLPGLRSPTRLRKGLPDVAISHRREAIWRTWNDPTQRDVFALARNLARRRFRVRSAGQLDTAGATAFLILGIGKPAGLVLS